VVSSAVARVAERAPLVLVVASMCMYASGAAFAKSLFDEASPTTVVWLRLAIGAVILIALARPRLRGRSQVDWQVVVGFGVSLAVMNWAYYESIRHIPLGLAVMFESTGPLAVALFGSRRLRDLVWVLLAAIGIVLLSFEPGDLNWPGVLFALLAGAAWGAYILLSKSTGGRWEGWDGLAVASGIAAVIVTPFAVTGDIGAVGDPHVAGIGVVVALLATVIPYSFELAALRTLRSSVFGVLMSLEPGIAAVIGFVGLGESLGPVQWLALVSVIAASVGATRSAPASRRPRSATDELPVVAS
jgi:inner membrane transporter RhtA